MKKCLIGFLVSLCLLALSLSQVILERYYSKALKITFFDVGQGDSVLLEFPLGKTLLVDAGGGSPKFTMGRFIVPELRSKGILNLDAVMLTHPDSDHILGLKDIAPSVTIKEYWLNPVFTDENIVPLLWQTEWIFKSNQVLPRYFSNRERFDWQGVQMEIIPSKGKGENNQCLVLELSYGGCRTLLTGDIESDGENVIANEITRPVHLLKVAHHGSSTSSTKRFLRKVSPKWSVISVGWGNRYGHPKDFVSERLRSLGSEIFRTDWMGYVEFTIDHNGYIFCKTSRGSCGYSKCE